MRMSSKIPITDNHAHLNPARGLGIKALKGFIKYGGKNLVLVNLLCKHYGIPFSPEGFSRVYRLHLNVVREARRRYPELNVYAVVGPHPAELTEALKEGISLRTAERVMKKAIDEALRVIKESELVIGLGEVGRPHYPVSSDIWEASNRVLKYALERAASEEVAVQIHMEDPNRKSLAEIIVMAEDAGMEPSRIVIHHAPPKLELAREFGLIFSVTGRAGFVRKCISEGGEFLLETDYLDDPRRPGAVLSLRSLPRLLNRLLKSGLLDPEVAWNINVRLPERIYRVRFR